MIDALEFRVESRNGPGEALSLRPSRLAIAGWAGRDAAALAHHVAELAALGVAPPSRTPLFYSASPELLTQADGLRVLGPDTSGEVEPLLVVAEGGELLVGVGSDHTDRRAEAWSVAHSKQLCGKPVAPVLWRFADVAAHWDALVLRAAVPAGDGEWQLYQEGEVAGLRRPDELLALAGDLGPNDAMLCGTLPAIGGIRSAPDFYMELHDPVLERTIRHRYSVHAMAVVT